MAASSLGEVGRAVLRRGLPLVTLLLLASIFLEPGLDGDLETTVQGAIGNTGDLAEAAIPGAILGAGAFLTTGGPLALLGLVALIGTALFAGLVPVYAGAAAIGAAVIAAFAAATLGRGDADGMAAARRARLLLVALLVAALGTFVGQALSQADGDPATAAPAAAEPSGAEAPPAIGATTGGFAFRRLTWARVPAAMADTGLDGAGPGQFQAIFPPYRDPAEIELSSRYRAEPTPIEVEHAHNDALTALVEYGWLGGGAFLLLLLVTIGRAVGAIAGPEDARRDFALVALAMIAMALVNAPLLYSPSPTSSPSWPSASWRPPGSTRPGRTARQASRPTRSSWSRPPSSLPGASTSSVTAAPWPTSRRPSNRSATGSGTTPGSSSRPLTALYATLRTRAGPWRRRPSSCARRAPLSPSSSRSTRSSSPGGRRASQASSTSDSSSPWAARSRPPESARRPLSSSTPATPRCCETSSA